MKDLHEATLKWAGDRGLLLNGTVISQALKLGSEMGELCHNLGNNNSIKDDVGDCLVVCTILADLQDFNLLKLINDIKPTHHKTPIVPTLISYLGELQDKALKKQEISTELVNIVSQLEGICKLRYTSLEECWAIAYDDIKDRKGFLTKEGVFVKSTDANYEELYANFLKEM